MAAGSLLKAATPFALGFLLALLTQSAAAQLPATRLGGIFPAGIKPGQTVEVTISGADLDDVGQLHFSHSGIKARQKMAEPGPRSTRDRKRSPTSSS